MSYAIDTAATIADLEAAGVAPAHAKAIVHAINGAAGDPVSKDDVKALRDELKAEIKALRDELKAEIQALRDEFKAENQALRHEFKAEIQALRDEFKAENQALRHELKAENQAMRDEFKATFATKADLEMIKSALTTRIVFAQIATAMLLFTMLKIFA